ncbi:hypothetical protein GF352_01065 [archaeon]|nr:hypothetical protein [archaeon]
MKSFNKAVKKTADTLRKWLGKKELVRVYTHLDADGISSGTIMIRLLKSLGALFQLTIIEQLTDEHINEIKKEGGLLVLLDFGSGQLSKLKDIIKKRKTLIIDHHQPQASFKSKNLVHLNPCLHGLDGGSQVSTSGLCYLLSKEFHHDKFNASLAIIGAQGDLQEMDSSINSSIINKSSLEQRQDLNIYGLNTRPVHKAIEYADGLVPGVSGDETSCVNFLKELKIPLKDGDDWRTINDLTSEEKQRLISSIIVKRSGLKKPEDIFRTVYELKIGRNRSTSEWSAVLNACGRMNMPSMGVSALLNPSYENKIDVVLKEYRNTIAEGLRWLEENMDNKELVKETKKALFFIAKDKVNYKVVGTLCSIKGPMSNKEFIVGFADNKDKTKVSVRRVGESEIKASDLVIKAAKGIGEGGGHAQAAGASIERDKEEVFIKHFNKALK